MQGYDLIQVLWVEDDPKVTETYPLKAEAFGLELVSFLCWDDAKEACEKMGGHLVTISSQAENDFVRDIMISEGRAGYLTLGFSDAEGQRLVKRNTIQRMWIMRPFMKELNYMLKNHLVSK